MRKAHQLLNDMDGDDKDDEGDAERGEEMRNDMLGLDKREAAGSIAVFRTAGSKSQIQVDEGNMRKAHQLLNDMDGDDKDDEGDAERGEEMRNDMLGLDKREAAGSIAVFRTAGSKSQIQVDEGNMRKAHQLLNDMDGDDKDDEGDAERGEEMRNDMLGLDKREAAGSIAVFRTAGSKSQSQVDEGNLRKAHQLLKNIDSDGLREEETGNGMLCLNKSVATGSTADDDEGDGDSEEELRKDICQGTSIHSSTSRIDSHKGQSIELCPTVPRSDNFNRAQKGLFTTVEEAYRRGALSSKVDEWIEHGVERITIQIDSQNASDVYFDALTGRPVFSSGYSSKSFGSVADIKQSMSQRGCDMGAVSNVWILNHKRWVVWNLACYERSFCCFVGGRYLSYERLILRLEGRYRKEICAGYRPITRMILNKDVSATLPMVLIVSRCTSPNVGESKLDDQSTQVTLRLTDGWYDIDAELDSPLSQFVKAGIIRVGIKLLVSNAKLRGTDDGIDPLDTRYQSDSKNNPRPYLTLTANSTRLAKWNCKLGLIRNIPGSGEKFSVVKRVSDIIAGGGSIPQLRLIIVRCYPIMYLEKGPNATSIPLTEAEEHQRLADIERRKLQAVEKIYEQVRQEVEKTSPTFWKRQHSNYPCDGNSSDDERPIITDLMAKQQVALQQRVHDAVEAELQLDDSLCRQSTPFIRVKVHTATAYGERSSESAILTVWDPSEDKFSLLKEGSVIEVQDVSVRPVPFDGLLQLSINGRAAVKGCETTDAERNRPVIHFAARESLDIFKVHKLSHTTFNSETSDSSSDRVPSTYFDVRGILVGDVKISSSNAPGFELYVTDESLLWLRVHFERPPTTLVKQWNDSGENERHTEPLTTIVVFKDLHLLPFDTSMNCAVAKYSALSSISRVSGSHQLQLEEKMKDFGEILRRMSCSIFAKLPWYRSDVYFSRIGYIIGVNSGGGETLLVDVDCGTTTHQWIMSSSILDAIRQSVGQEPSPPTSLLESQESRLLEIRTLDFLFRIRHVLWQFDVISIPKHVGTTCTFVVHRIAMVDQRCLAMFYSTQRKA